MSLDTGSRGACLEAERQVLGPCQPSGSSGSGVRHPEVGWGGVGGEGLLRQRAGQDWVKGPGPGGWERRQCQTGGVGGVTGDAVVEAGAPDDSPEVWL